MICVVVGQIQQSLMVLILTNGRVIAFVINLRVPVKLWHHSCLM